MPACSKCFLHVTSCYKRKEKKGRRGWPFGGGVWAVATEKREEKQVGSLEPGESFLFLGFWFWFLRGKRPREKGFVSVPFLARERKKPSFVFL